MTQILTVQEDKDSGELFIQIPQTMLDSVGWKEGDTIEWTDNKDGTWSLTKKVKDEQN